MKAVMYHYVRPEGDRPPFYYHLSLSDFRKQLDRFDAEHGFVNRERFLDACNGGPVPTDGIVLTFDDGLLDHHQWVLPELESRDLWGIFYVPTAPLTDDRVLDVHRIHSLLGVYGGDRVLETLQPLVSEEMVPDARRQSFRQETYSRQENADSTTLVKRILNYYVAYTHRPQLIDQLVDALPAAAVDPSALYMSEEQVRELQAAGMIVGSHSVSHRVFSKLSVPDQQREIDESFAALEDVLGVLDVRTFCYPYGGDHTFTNETIELLEAADCRFAFNVESRDIAARDMQTSPQTLPRYDCNEFPHGDASGTLG